MDLCMEILKGEYSVIDRNAVLLITGASGMVGGVTLELLQASGFTRIFAPDSDELDLRDTVSVDRYFEEHRPAHVLMIGAKVGGIAANIKDPMGFTDENLRMTLNLFSACHRFGTLKNLFLGSSCIYPTGHSDLLPEEALMTGPLEPTNEGYALSKIVGLKLAKYYHDQYGMLTVCPMLCNVYGKGDHFDFGRAHVLSSLVRRFTDARDQGDPSITLWGTGKARREFLHSTDAARAILFFLDNITVPDHINVGPGTDVSILELAEMIAAEVGFNGQIDWDPSKPDGMLRKCMDVNKLHQAGFMPEVVLREGIRRTINEYATAKASGKVME